MRIDRARATRFDLLRITGCAGQAPFTSVGLFPEAETLGPGGWDRVFNGGSAGAFGFLGAYAVLSRRTWLWLGAFLLWEPVFWYFISNDFTVFFHAIAVATGIAVVWSLQSAHRRPRLR